jgi:polyferredoxin
MARSDDIALPVLSRDSNRIAGTRMGRRRALVLVVVHLVIAAHVVHFTLAGSSLTPLEPSEAADSIRTGVINAGAIFLCLLVVSTLVLGRFFCGWACHVVAYQDLARWILVRVGLRPRPVRSRLLMLVPIFAVLWLYGRPLLARWRAETPAAPGLHLVTDDLWATFPGPAVAALTFVVCGGLAVCFLGAKGFCTYGCPYGALFATADRAARGRIRVNESCDHTGNCTRTCSSNVDVAREVAEFGMVVDPGCMKCMDCVAGCPNEALSFGFGPGPRRGKRDARAARRPARGHDLTWPEEIVAAAAFAGLFVVLDDLYRTIPFLLAVGLAVIGAALLVPALRLVAGGEVVVQRVTLKRRGRLTGPGWAFVVGAVVGLAFVGHGAVVQWHTTRAVDAFARARTARVEGDVPTLARESRVALAHLDAGERWGLLFVRGFGRMRGELLRWSGAPEAALPHLDAELAHGGRNRNVWLYRGLALVALDRHDAARASFDEAFARAAPRERFLRLDWELERLPGPSATRRETVELRLDALRRGLAAHPGDGALALAACRLLVRGPVEALRDRAEALRTAEQASREAARPHADLLAMLAWLYDDAGRPGDAVRAASASIEAARAAGQADIERAGIPRNRLANREVAGMTGRCSAGFRAGSVGWTETGR